MKEQNQQNPQNNSKVPDKNKILSPNEKLKEMQAFINSKKKKKEVPKETPKTKAAEPKRTNQIWILNNIKQL